MASKGAVQLLKLVTPGFHLVMLFLELLYLAPSLF